jgi:hypothetical protein
MSDLYALHDLVHIPWDHCSAFALFSPCTLNTPNKSPPLSFQITSTQNEVWGKNLTGARHLLRPQHQSVLRPERHMHEYKCEFQFNDILSYETVLRQRLWVLDDSLGRDASSNDVAEPRCSTHRINFVDP